MTTLRLLFLHGLESGPHSTKARHLQSTGRYEVIAPQLPTEPLIDLINTRRRDPSALSGAERQRLSEVLQPSLQVARDAVKTSRPDVVVGSSFGGGVACLLAHEKFYDGPLVLLAPAGRKLFMIEALPTRTGRVVVLHGRRDSVVPVADSQLLAATSQGDVVLWLVDDEHRLHEAVRTGILERAVELSLSNQGHSLSAGL